MHSLCALQLLSKKEGRETAFGHIFPRFPSFNERHFREPVEVEGWRVDRSQSQLHYKWDGVPCPTHHAWTPIDAEVFPSSFTSPHTLKGEPHTVQCSRAISIKLPQREAPLASSERTWSRNNKQIGWET